MNTKLDGLSISRRGFLAFAGAASGVALLVPRQILAQDDGLVQMARRSASSGNITVQKLRGNISVLMGAGGNIAVLPGPAGKLLIDAGNHQSCASLWAQIPARTENGERVSHEYSSRLF